MFTTQNSSPPIDNSEIMLVSRKIADDFLKTSESGSPLDVYIAYYPDRKTYDQEARGAYQNPVYCETKADKVQVYLCGVDLVGIPEDVFQGWLDQELSLSLLKAEENRYQFNFSRDILPLFNVTGGAVPYLRNIVEYIRLALLKYVGTRQIIDMGRGMPQVQYFFHKLGQSQQFRQEYEDVLDHGWQRSFILLQLMRDYFPVMLLEQAGICRDFTATFWEFHDYVIPSDRALLEEWAKLPEEYVGRSFSQLLVAMFKSLKYGLLMRRTTEYLD